MIQKPDTGANLLAATKESCQLLTASVVAHSTLAYGFVPFASRGGIVTNQLINTLRDRHNC
jgi:hypothetical protein